MVKSTSETWAQISGLDKGGGAPSTEDKQPEVKAGPSEPSQTQYSPGSTMYELGFRNQAEYWEATNRGLSYGPHEGSRVPDTTLLVNTTTREGAGGVVRVAPVDYTKEGGEELGSWTNLMEGAGKASVAVIAESERGEKAQKLLSPETARRITEMPPRQQFEELQRLGVYPSDWAYSQRGKALKAEDIAGYEQEQKAYKKAVEELKGNIKTAPMELQEAFKQGGVEGYNKAVDKYNARIISEVEGAIKAGEVPEPIAAAYKTGGLLAYNNAVESYNRNLKTNYTELPDGKYISNTDLKSLKKENERQYQILTTRGISAYETFISEAESTLREYRNRDGTYNIADALLTRNPEVTQAVEVLFNAKVVEDVREKHRPGLTIGTGVPRKQLIEQFEIKEPAPISPVSDKVTPMTKYNMTQGILSQVPKPVLAAVGVAALTPVPHDDAVALAVLAATLGTIATVNLINKLKARNKELPKPSNIYVLDEKGKGDTAKAVLIDPKTLYPLGGLQLDIPPKVEAPKLELIPGKTKILAGTELAPPRVPYKQEGYQGERPEKVIIIDPKLDLNKKMAEVIKAQAAVQAAADKAKESLPRQVGTIPINYDKILDEVRAARGQAEKAQAFKKINTAIRKYRSGFEVGESELYTNSYADYLRRKAILDAAKRQYIASLNPTPVKGAIGKEAISTIAEARLLEALGYETAGKSDKELQGVLDNLNKDAIDKLASRYSSVYNRALAQGATEKEAQSSAYQALDEMVNEAVETQSATAIKPLAATGAATAVAKGVATTKAGEAARAVAAPIVAKPATMTGIGAGAFPISPPKGGATDSEKRAFLDKVEGLVTRRRGELDGQSVWLVDYYPYGPKDKLTLLGNPPRGAKPASGKGSLKASATLIRGIPPTAPFKRDTGAVDDIISYKDDKVVIKSVKDKEVGRNRPPKIKPPRVFKTTKMGNIETSKNGKRRHLSISDLEETEEEG